LNFATSLTLLDQLRFGPHGDQLSLFVDIYAPLILKWNREAGLQHADSEDVAQEIMTAVMENIGTFSRERDGSFRKWLKTIAVNRVRRFFQKKRPLSGIEDLEEAMQPAPSQTDLPYAENYYVEVLHAALSRIFQEFRPLTWEVFLDTLLLNRPVEEVARELGLSPNAVYVSRHRILARLGEVVQDLIEGDDLPAISVDMVERIAAISADNIRQRLGNGPVSSAKTPRKAGM